MQTGCENGGLFADSPPRQPRADIIIEGKLPKARQLGPATAMANGWGTKVMVLRETIDIDNANGTQTPEEPDKPEEAT